MPCSSDDEDETVAVTDNGDGTYSFIMPASNVAVNVEFELLTYDVWVGGEQFNGEKLTINGTTGTATYDPVNKTLTLNNFSYTGQGYEYDSLWCAAIFSKNDLTVKVVGSNTVTASVTGDYTAEALYVWGALTITGDSGSSLTLTGAGREGVYCDGNLSIENVTVNATGTSGLRSGEGNITINNAKVTATATADITQYAAAIYAYEGNITIENSTVTANAPHANAVYSYKSELRYTIKNSNVTISAAEYGIGLTVWTCLFVENSTVEVTSGAGLAIVNIQNDFGAEPSFTGTHVVYAGDDAGSATEADASADATYANKYVKIVPAYPVWVGGEQFTSEKLTIDGDTGTATYDPATNTLTLNGFSYTGEGYEYDPSGSCAAIYFNPADENAELTIELVGTNTVMIDNSECTSDVIYIANGNLIIEGNGSLTATGDTGIYAAGPLTINGGIVTVKGSEAGIYVENNITIDSGTVKATASGEYGIGIVAAGTVIVNGGTVEAMSTGEYGYGITTYDGVSCNGDLAVYAGEAAPGELVTSPTTSTYISKYVKIAPAEPEVETKSTTVTYQVDPTFTVTIPATVALGETATIKAENVVVAKGKQVEVALTNANGFTVATPQGAELGYTVKNGETTVNEGDVVLTVNPDGGKTGETTLMFVAPETAQFAGDYTGTITFIIAVNTAENN
jgi:hypothetical protein